MAGDLIPPPSPAGKPDPDAGREQARAAAAPAPHVEPDELLLAARPDEPAAVAAAEAPRRSRYAARFGLLTGILAGLAVTAIVAAVVLVAREEPVDPAAGWSAWKPTSTDPLVRAAEIAQHVGRQYRMDDGSQLVDVEAGPLALEDVPLTPVVRTAAKGGDIVPIYGEGMLFVLNGLGKDGSISREEPSPERLALVEREALELALYTFRYVDDVDHVVALLPPAPPDTEQASSTSAGDAAPLSADKPVRSLLFRPGDLRDRLEAPLSATFPTAPPRPATMSQTEEAALAQLLEPHTFDAQVVPNQAGQGFLVLDPPKQASATDQVLKSTIPGSGSG